MAAGALVVVPGARRAPELGSGSIEALKWLGLVLMVIDHVNKFHFHGKVGWMFDAGRLAMPLFTIVLAHNLAHGDERSAWRAARRMLLVGLLAAPVFTALQRGYWWPLNVMFMLATSSATIALLQRERLGGGAGMALWLALAGGMLVEFWWPAVGATVAAWYWWRRPGWVSALAWVACMALLVPINGNFWAFAAVPLVALATRIDLPLPRWRWVFYAAYPLHLVAIWSTL